MWPKILSIPSLAAAKNVIERQLYFQIKAAISFEQFWQLRIEMSGTLRKEMAGLAPAQLPTIKQAVADVARRCFMSGTMSFPAEALIVSGRKSVPERIDEPQECLSAASVSRWTGPDFPSRNIENVENAP
jgi:hypothetical protein